MNKISKQIPHQNDVLMAKKHMKRYLLSYGIRELWIKTTINHFIFSRMTKFQKTQHQILVRVWNSKKFLLIATRMAKQNSKCYSHLGKHFDKFHNAKHSLHMIQQSDTLVYTQIVWKLIFTQKPTWEYLQQSL